MIEICLFLPEHKNMSIIYLFATDYSLGTSYVLINILLIYFFDVNIQIGINDVALFSDCYPVGLDNPHLDCTLAFNLSG